MEDRPSFLPQREDGALPWVNAFTESKGATLVINDIRCETPAHLEAQIKMGFKEGYSAGLDNLEELLARLAEKGKGVTARIQ